MGKPLMLKEEDHRRLEALKQRLGAQSKVQVLRSALEKLEAEADRADKIERWKRAAKLAAESGADREVIADFQKHSLLKAAENEWVGKITDDTGEEDEQG